MPIATLSTQTIGRILEGGASVCRAAGIPIAGGHTIDSVEPIYGLVALGLVHPKRVKRNADAQVGDLLVLGKPIGVGIYSAALKKERLSAEGYAALIAATTQLNTPGPELAGLAGVHALTDVTGFGLAGHALEMARGAGVCVELNWCSRTGGSRLDHRRQWPQLGRLWRRSAIARWVRRARARLALRPPNGGWAVGELQCRSARGGSGGVCKAWL
jgi:selenophosphate synthetase-related protein